MVLGATVQRCRVHFMRNALACVGKKDRPIATAALRTAFDQDTFQASKEHWAKLIDAFTPRHEKLAELMRRAEEGFLVYKSLLKEHQATDQRGGIFPHKAAAIRLIGALMLEQRDEWAITRRYMTLEIVVDIRGTTSMESAKIAVL